MRVKAAIEVSAPREAVWAWISDPSRYLDFMDGVTRWEVESERPSGLGARYRMLMRVGSVVRQAVETLELSTLAKHAHLLAQSFNTFYHRHPVVKEPDEAARALKLAVVRLYCDGMGDLLGLMGIAPPARM